MSTGDPLRGVSIVGIGQIPVLKESPLRLKEMGAEVVKMAMADADVDHVDALFAGNMLSDELQNQKHIATQIASEAGLRGIEALQVRAATATGAAALRMAYFAVASGEARADVGVADARGVGHEGDVAHQRDRRAEARRHAVDRRDEGRLAVDQRPVDGPAAHRVRFSLI